MNELNGCLLVELFFQATDSYNQHLSKSIADDQVSDR